MKNRERREQGKILAINPHCNAVFCVPYSREQISKNRERREQK